MMKKVPFYLILLSAVLWARCSPFMPSNQPLRNTPTEWSYENQTPSSTSTLVPTVMLTATLSPTMASFAYQCVGSQQSLPADIEGHYVLSGSYDLYLPARESHQSLSYILIPASRDKIQLPHDEDGISGFVVSPNKKWLAYIQRMDASNRLIIVGGDGKVFKEYLGQHWWGLVGWLDDSHLLISKFAKENPFPTIVLNPSVTS
jgi:hypothetical protein